MKPNRLIKEKSPYLLEHAYNPVEWYTWGSEAFERAKKENKPIFLSIGYSSCHWCHVMARESFENPEIAKILNDNFVPIKVDREARPDVDELYMKAVITMTGSGGWPLSVFLTPTLEPFYGGTYYPPEPRGGMPSFPQLLSAIDKAWKSDQSQILQSAKQLEQSLKAMYEIGSSGKEKLSEGVIDDCYSILASSFDETFGGFGMSPKFPTPSNLFFLFRYYSRTGMKAPLIMALKTLDGMASGGIRDQVGGGFHRYSVDRQWLVPHFEKMLYDNALLCLAYTEAYQITKDPDYRTIALEILDWATSEMISKSSGGFYSALDADSPDGEGSYYVWNREQVEKALGPLNFDKTKTDLVCEYYGISEHGNFEDDFSILTRDKARIEDLKRRFPKADFDEVTEKATAAMLRSRKNRPAPKTDDKILTSWNGLMIAAFAKAFEVYGKEKYLDNAIRAADFLLNTMWGVKVKSVLEHWYRDGEAMDRGTLDDYSFFTYGLLELYEATFDSKYLMKAIDLANAMISRFYDSKSGGFFLTDESSELLVRPKDAYDGALPSGNSVATLVLLKLGTLTSNEDFKKHAEGSLMAFWESMSRGPASYVFSILALDYFLSTSQEIVLSGSKNTEEYQKMLEVTRETFLPNSIVAYAEEGKEGLIPLIEGRVQKGKKPTAFVCSNYTCKLPSESADELSLALQPVASNNQQAVNPVG